MMVGLSFEKSLFLHQSSPLSLGSHLKSATCIQNSLERAAMVMISWQLKEEKRFSKKGWGFCTPWSSILRPPWHWWANLNVSSTVFSNKIFSAISSADLYFTSIVYSSCLAIRSCCHVLLSHRNLCNCFLYVSLKRCTGWVCMFFDFPTCAPFWHVPPFSFFFSLPPFFCFEEWFPYTCTTMNFLFSVKHT